MPRSSPTHSGLGTHSISPPCGSQSAILPLLGERGYSRLPRFSPTWEPTLKQLARHYALILLIAVPVLFTNLGAARLWDRDEPRNAGCAVEMLERADWVVPYFNGDRRDAKPVLLYWLIMSAYAMFGINEFAARFWSATLAVGTVVATYHLGRRLFHPQVGLWGAVVLSTSLMFDVVGRAATPDSTLIFFVTTSLAVYVYGVFPPREAGAAGVVESRHPPRLFPDRWLIVGFMYGLMGVAVLAKGPVGFLLPTAVIGMFLLMMRLPSVDSRDSKSIPADATRRTRWFRRGRHFGRTLLRPFAPVHFLRTCWSMRLITATGIVLAVALPWYLWASMRSDGQWAWRFLMDENLGRALEPKENHSGSVFYYPVAIMAGFFPWSVFLVTAVVGAVAAVRRRDSCRCGYLLMLCWLGVIVGLFSLARTKLPNYVTPAYPALALLTGAFLYHWTHGTSMIGRRTPRFSLELLAIVGGVFVVGVYVAAGQFLPGDQGLAAIGLILIAGALVCWQLVNRRRIGAAAFAFAATATVFATVLFGFATARVSRHQNFHELLSSEVKSPHLQLFTYGRLEPSWVYYSGRSICELSGPLNEVAEALETSPDAILITTDRHLASELSNS